MGHLLISILLATSFHGYQGCDSNFPGRSSELSAGRQSSPDIRSYYCADAVDHDHPMSGSTVSMLSPISSVVLSLSSHCQLIGLLLHNLGFPGLLLSRPMCPDVLALLPDAWEGGEGFVEHHC